MTDLATMAASARGEDCLPVVRAWLDAMHDKNISYCHFKSNAEVAAGLAGITDMDVLADRRQYAATVEQLCAAGFKRFKTAAQMDYPAVDDYLACDRESGRLVHLHLHWQMIAGEPYLKGYRLPWEEMLLSGRIWDGEAGIHVAAPEAELLLLLTRAVLKLRSRDRLRRLLGRPYFRGSLRREYEWLVARCDRSAAVELIRKRLGDGGAEVIGRAIARGTIDDADIFAFRRATTPVLRSYRRFSVLEARLRRWAREARSYWGRFVKRWRAPATLYRRGPAGGGVVVALLGADGSGKSTQQKALVSWLSWKADVLPLYLGSGDGPQSLVRRTLASLAGAAARARRKLHGRKRRQREDGATAAPARAPLGDASLLSRSWSCLWALVLAGERRAKLRRAFRARDNGVIVITDRFPQNQIMGYNDGPLLDDLQGRSAPWGGLARWEARLYREMTALQPDLVVKLTLSAATALERKPSTPAEQVRLKTAAVAELRFGDATRVVEVDAGGSLDAVSLAVKRAVWDAL